MKLLDLWNVTDGESLFLMTDDKRIEILDGPGYPVANGVDVSDLVVLRIRSTIYPLYGCVIEVIAQSD